MVNIMNPGAWGPIPVRQMGRHRQDIMSVQSAILRLVGETE
jgi:hypothetical protein